MIGRFCKKIVFFKNKWIKWTIDNSSNYSHPAGHKIVILTTSNKQTLFSSANYKIRNLMAWALLILKLKNCPQSMSTHGIWISITKPLERRCVIWYIFTPVSYVDLVYWHMTTNMNTKFRFGSPFFGPLHLNFNHFSQNWHRVVFCSIARPGEVPRLPTVGPSSRGPTLPSTL